MMQEYIKRHHIARRADAGGVARRGGLQRRSEARPMEVRSDRTPQATGTAGHNESWYLHPKLAEVLRETHGVMIYQEDVLRVAHALAGLSLGQADTLRRSMSGKLRSPEAMAKVRGGFIAGCETHGVGRDIAEETWRQIESFAGYAFCKAHSASYALLSLQVAYLKAHHPAEFMAAVISNQGGFYATAAYISSPGAWACASCCPT